MGRLFELKSLCMPFKTVVAIVTSRIWYAHLGHLLGSRLGAFISSGCLGHVKLEYFDCVSC